MPRACHFVIACNQVEVSLENLLQFDSRSDHRIDIADQDIGDKIIDKLSTQGHQSWAATLPLHILHLVVFGLGIGNTPELNVCSAQYQGIVARHLRYSPPIAHSGVAHHKSSRIALHKSCYFSSQAIQRQVQGTGNVNSASPIANPDCVRNFFDLGHT